jgi:type IV pilus assembly protein PilW
MLTRTARCRPAARRGFTLVELMIGIAVGLFVVSGAALMFSSFVDDNRRLILETQIQQDLRAAADLITRDLRRAGFWRNAEAGVWQPGAGPVPANPYEAVVGEDPGEAGSSIEYGYSLDESVPQDENNALDNHDVSGFRVADGAIWMQLGRDNWQQLTDPGTLRITAFTVTMTEEPIDLSSFCSRPCDAGNANCPPVQHVRSFTVFIEGEAANDATVRRSMRTTVRTRNDAVTGACQP